MTIQLVKANFAKSTIVTGIGSGATSVTLFSGTGTKFPSSGNFRAVLWGAAYQTAENDPSREIVTAVISSGDTFTITRAQEGTAAHTWTALTNFALVITKGVITDLETEIENKLSNVLTDPGNAGTFPVTASGSIAITTAGAETRSLPNPTFAGQELFLNCNVYVGDCVITATSGVNVAADTHITMTAAGQMIFLIGATIGGALQWRMISNDGCTLGA